MSDHVCLVLKTSPVASNCIGGKKSKVYHGPQGPIWSTPTMYLSSSLVTLLFYAVFPWFLKMWSMLLLLNLQFSLPGILFPDHFIWYTPSLPLSLYKCYLVKEAFPDHIVQNGTQICIYMHFSSLSLPFTLLYFFPRSIYHHMIRYISRNSDIGTNKWILQYNTCTEYCKIGISDWC